MAQVAPALKALTDRGKRVFIIGGDLNYTDMFQRMGWTIVQDIKEARLVQFTGGSDVSPGLYGERKHPSTGCNPHRDRGEGIIYDHCFKRGLPMAGICRGGQFLNVMCGGHLWQHVDRHALPGTHKVKCHLTQDEFQATSTHHQMMIPTRAAMIVGVASESTRKEKMSSKGPMSVLQSKNVVDIEVLFYRQQKILCFQPHPEIEGHTDLRRRYFYYIKELLNIG